MFVFVLTFVRGFIFSVNPEGLDTGKEIVEVLKGLDTGKETFSPLVTV